MTHKLTREDWLRKCVTMINERIFDNGIELDKEDYQIACGWCKSSKAIGETVFPYEGEDVELDDFFPVTIHMSVTEESITDMIGALVHECIHAFFKVKNHSKEFAYHAKRVGFEKPYTQLHMGEELKIEVEDIYSEMKRLYGDFPGKLIKGKKKSDKEKKKSVFKLFCPDCGFTVKAKKDDVDKFGRPRCACGGLMALDLEDYEDNEDQRSQD